MATPAPTPDNLLAPISDESPVGEDITLTPEWPLINQARRRDRLTGQPKEDWPVIRQLLTEALARKSKDLRLAVWLAEANIKLDGFAGLRDGLQLLRGLIETYWDSGLYPQIENGEIQFRAKPLEWLGGDNLPQAVRAIPLTSRGGGGAHDYSYSDFRQSRAIGWEKNIRDANGDIDPAKEEKRRETLKRGGVSAEMFEQATKETRRARLEAKWVDFEAAWEEFQELDRVLDQKFEDKKFKADAPGTSEAKEALEDCRRVLNELLEIKRKEEPDPVETPNLPAVDGQSPVTDPLSPGAQFGFDGSDAGDSWAEAEKLVRQGKYQEGVAEMTRLASRQYGRMHFQHRLRLAEICLQNGRMRLGIAILEELAKSIDERKLYEWEAPELLGRVWGQLYRHYRDKEPGSEELARGNNYFDRLCRLDPWQAFRWEK